MKRQVLSYMLFYMFAAGYSQACYDYDHIQIEQLGRGAVAFTDKYKDSVAISWRLLKDDKPSTAFNIYEGKKKLNLQPLKNSTFYKVPINAIGKDISDCQFTVKTVDEGTESGRKDGQCMNLSQHYHSIRLDIPDEGVTPDGRRYRYSANDASVGDVDGDGNYEIILKWDPSNAKDNSHEGFTGNVLLDCYTLQGERLWRIDLGKNIRAGAHYTQFMVYDLDNDGKAEVVVKTADGTIDGTGRCIGDSTKDYRISGQINKYVEGKVDNHSGWVQGRVLEGPEYLTVFEGSTGKALDTVDYIPSRGNVAEWGDSYGNRCDRFLACVAYLDGVHPSVVFSRGYYTRTVLAAWDWDGKHLKSRWVFDTNEDKWRRYAGQGNHNLRVADVDGDGCDEITFGSMAVDNDGTGLYNTLMGHGDAIHLMPFYPDSTGLQVWDVHENRRDGSDFRDAKTGKVIFQIKSNTDVGRGMAADIDPTNYGVEMWSSASGGILNVKGELIFPQARIPVNSAVWWDGDLLREMLDRNSISKFNWTENACHIIEDFDKECSFNNGTKSNPCLSVDIFGDWREEVIVRTFDNTELRIYTTSIPTSYRMPTLMQDIPYRLGVAVENVAYNQPPETGFYLGAESKLNY